jgi:hypothetical protein
MHELGHVFGIGTADSWQDKLSGGAFTGASARAANGGVNPPVDGSGGHWKQGTNSTVNGVAQAVVMEPSLLTGTRRSFTRLDYAGLADVGWQVPATAAITMSASPPPAPAVAVANAANAFAQQPIKPLADEIFGQRSDELF